MAEKPSEGGGWRWGHMRCDTLRPGHMLPGFIRLHLKGNSKVLFQEGGHRTLRGPSECTALSHALVTCPVKQA